MPIKNIEPGINVKSMTGLNKVTHVFKNSVLTERLCCVKINNKKIVTTVDHLFFTSNGWVKAGNLVKGDIVYGSANMQKLWEDLSGKGRTELCSEVLLPRMLSNLSREESGEEGETGKLSDLWETNGSSKLFLEEDLFNSLQKCSNIEIGKSDYEYRIWTETTETIIRKDVEIKSFTQSRSDKKDFRNKREKWNITPMERTEGWQWEIHNSTDSLIRSIRKWMGIGVCDTYGIQSENGERNVSYLLQSRPRLSPNETCDRGGWCRPQLEKWVVERCKEDTTSSNFRVDGVEVYKRGHNEELFLGSFTDSELSKDYVDLFDIEVENDHCYFANDILVHNCHSLSNQAWQAMLKTLEEPPAKSIFIFCTTDPQKIPNTILSRVQRYNFQRISQEGIVQRLLYILRCEGAIASTHLVEAVEYIAKIADGGMRDAITLMDKCLSYSSDLTLDNVVKALGVADYGLMFDLNNAILGDDPIPEVISIIDNVYKSGLDLKLFIKNYFEFILDMNIWAATNSFEATKIPATWIGEAKTYGQAGLYLCHKLLKFLIELQNIIKWEQNPKAMIIAKFIVFIESEIVE